MVVLGVEENFWKPERPGSATGRQKKETMIDMTDIKKELRRDCEPAKPGSLHPAGSAARWSARFIFAWYDLWVGIFWDKRKRKLYILPVPCVGVVIEFPMRQNAEVSDGGPLTHESPAAQSRRSLH